MSRPASWDRRHDEAASAGSLGRRLDVASSFVRNKCETPMGFNAPMEVDVALVRWPADEEKRRLLAELGQPRLLLVDGEAEPPTCTDQLEDWIRLPASDVDARARVRSLERRSRELTPTVPEIVGDGAVRYRSERIDLPLLQLRLMEPLIAHYGSVVSRETLMGSAWPAGRPSRNTLDVHIVRLRKRLAPYGLQIRTVRSRGYMLAPADGE